MKRLHILLLLVFSLPGLSYGQRLSKAEKEKIITRVAKNTCNCISSYNLQNMTPMQIQQQLGTCMMQQIANWDYNKTRAFDIDLNNYDKMYRFGERVGKKMASVCPRITRLMTGQSDYDTYPDETFPLDEITYETCDCAGDIEWRGKSQNEINELLGLCIYDALSEYDMSTLLQWGIDLNDITSMEAAGRKIGAQMAVLCPNVISNLIGNNNKNITDPNSSVGAPPRPPGARNDNNRTPNVNKQPPLLSIEKIELSSSTLHANDDIILNITVKNSGPGAAAQAYVQLTGFVAGLNYPNRTVIPNLPAINGSQIVSIRIQGDASLINSSASLQVEVVEPDFNVKIPGKKVTFNTRALQKPQLILAQYALVESQSSSPNRKIDINEIIDLKFSVQNVGQGQASNVNIQVKNEQAGVMFLGVVENGNVQNRDISFGAIEAGKYQTITHRYFINSDFKERNVIFTIECNEQMGSFGFQERKAFPINSTLKEEGYIRVVDPGNEPNTKPVLVEEIPPLSVDVDINIPTTNIKKNNTYVLIIGNEDYQSKQKALSSEQNVAFAENDAQVFGQYCNQVLGVPNKQIKMLINATAAEIYQGLAWISNLAEIEGPKTELIFYYAGHGLPDEKTKEPYLVPVDVSGDNLAFAVKLTDVYDKLTEKPTVKTTVFLDACFSGGGRNASLVASRGVKVRPKPTYLQKNLVVFSSSTGEESSSAMKEKQHGFFTYFLLKKLQETKGVVSFGELSDYIYKNVRKEAGLIGKIQTPQVQAGNAISTSWKTLRFDK